MESGNVIQIAFPLTESEANGLSHASLIKRIRCLNDYSRVIIDIMNPGPLGGQQKYNSNLISNIASISR